MRVALIGNMNNNNFALMRYFHDLGVEAHLFLFANDGCGSLTHFRPECDTWEITRWSKYIHHTDFINLPIAVFFFPCNRNSNTLTIDNNRIKKTDDLQNIQWKHNLSYYISEAARKIVGFIVRAFIIIKGYRKNTVNRLPMKSAFLSLWSLLLFNSRTFYGRFDAYIGSGISPALLDSHNIVLDIYYPYCAGIEFVGGADDLVAIRESKGLKKKYLCEVRHAQIKGIYRSKYCISADESLSKEVFNSIGVEYLSINVPMVYNHEDTKRIIISSKLRNILDELKKYDYKIVSHSRHMWVNPGTYSKEEWERNSKHNDWLIHEYASFVKSRPDSKSLLIMLEYGPDYLHTKNLCEKYELNSKVLWLGIMDRRELMLLIEHCEIGVGEFYTDHGMILGGTGWEVLAAGKPLLQGYHYDIGEFEEIYGFPPPPMLPVTKQSDIYEHLVEMAEHPDKAEKIGLEAREWFNKYNGTGLARIWLELLQKQ